jgi:hypothetical protein
MIPHQKGGIANVMSVPDPRHLVEDAALPQRGDDPDRDRDRCGQTTRVGDQEDRRRQALGDERPGRLVVIDRVAQVPVDEPLHEELVLRPEGLVEPELG